jgi:hypothetical protein
MSATKLLYDVLAAITITPGTLASGSARGSASVDWSSVQALDASLYVEFTLASGAPAGQKKVNVYLYLSMDGTNYTEGSAGTDAAVTITNPTNLIFLGAVETPTDKAGAASWKKWFPSIASKFDGIMPLRWGIVLENQSGQAFLAGGVAAIAKYKAIGAQNL